MAVRLPATTLTYLLGFSGIAFGSSLGEGASIGASLGWAGVAMIAFLLIVLPFIPTERRRMLRMLDEYEAVLEAARA